MWYLCLFSTAAEVLSLFEFVVLNCLWGRNKGNKSWQAEQTCFVCFCFLVSNEFLITSLFLSCRSTWPSGISYSSWRRGIWSSCITCTVTASPWSCGSSWPPGSRARTGELPAVDRIWHKRQGPRQSGGQLFWAARFNIWFDYFCVLCKLRWN